MPRFNEAVRQDIANSVLCWLATVAADGMPNVTPKEMFAACGEARLAIADIASANSVRNIRVHPQVCVSFVDVFRQRGFKMTGQARIVSSDDAEFATFGTDLLERAGEAYPIRNLIVVEVSRIARIWAPSYALVPDRSEDQRMAEAYRTYGVRPDGLNTE